MLTGFVFHDVLARPPAGHARVIACSANSPPRPKDLRERELRGGGIEATAKVLPSPTHRAWCASRPSSPQPSEGCEREDHGGKRDESAEDQVARVPVAHGTLLPWSRLPRDGRDVEHWPHDSAMVVAINLAVVMLSLHGHFRSGAVAPRRAGALQNGDRLSETV